MTTTILSVDHQLADRAQRIAADRNTTLDHLVHEILERLTLDDPTTCESAAARLSKTIGELSRPLGGKLYENCDELYDQFFDTNSSAS